MRSLSDYLNIEDTVQFIKEVTKAPFFNKGNLFDLAVKRELEPIVYFEGYGLTWRNKHYSPYPEDFEGMDEWSEGVERISQSNYVKGYFYILYGETIINSNNPMKHRNFNIQSLVSHRVIPDQSLPNGGLNSKGGIFRKTPLYVTDFILLSTENLKDEIIDPYFSENDIKFYVLDIIKMLEKHGYYSADDEEASQPANDKDVNAKDSAYHLIAILKDLLLDPDIAAYHFKTDTNESTSQPTQAGLSAYIESMNIKGLKARNINGIFSEANRLLKDAKKE